MTIEKVERRMRSYLTFSIKNRQVQVVKQAVFECSFVVLEPKVPKIIPGIGHRIDRKFFEEFDSWKSEIETAVVTCVVSNVALCICGPGVVEGRRCIVIVNRVHECYYSLQYDFFKR